MNKRTRKKYLKSKGLYVDRRELWDLDCNIARYILPRLKAFRKLKSPYKGYPAYDEADTPENWDECIDKMIRSFEICISDVYDDFWLDETLSDDEKRHLQEELNADYAEGMRLFAKYFRALWW